MSPRLVTGYEDPPSYLWSGAFGDGRAAARRGCAQGRKGLRCREHLGPIPIQELAESATAGYGKARSGD